MPIPRHVHSNRQETAFSHTATCLRRRTVRHPLAMRARRATCAALFLLSEGQLCESIEVTHISCVQDARRTVLFHTQSSVAAPQRLAPAGDSVHDVQTVLFSFLSIPYGPLGPLTMQVPQLGSRLYPPAHFTEGTTWASAMVFVTPPSGASGHAARQIRRLLVRAEPVRRNTQYDYVCSEKSGWSHSSNRTNPCLTVVHRRAACCTCHGQSG